MTRARKSDKGRREAAGSPGGFTDAERAAMKERARELKAEARAGKSRAAGERAVLATIAGMPAYADKDGKVVCFFQAATKFKTRIATFSFSDAANLDEGAMWPIGFGLKELTASEEERIGALVRKAVS